MARGDGQAKDDASFALPPFLPTISIGIQAPKAKGYALSQKEWPADPKIANKLNQHLSILKTTVMKKLIFPAVAALALGLASCSSDEVNPGNGGGTVNYAEGGYVRLSINMPSVKGTRATEATDDHANDKFYDGLASEYAVKNAQLILFHGANEADATFHSAYDLTTSMSMENPADNQITSMTKIVKQTDNKSHSDNLYALVVLNNNGVTKVVNTPAGTTPAVANGLEVIATDGTVTPITNATKFKDFRDMLSETPTTLATGEFLPAPKFASSVPTNGIFMTNAPLADNPGNASNPTSAKVMTLVNVSNSVYKTEKEAQNAPAADIFVERGVAKVTFSKDESKGGGTGSLSGVEFTKDGNRMDYDIVGWNLDVTNKKSFLVRHTTNDQFGLKSSFTTGDQYRFVGDQAIVAQTNGNTVTDPTITRKNYYRTYWGEDPNYEKKKFSTPEFNVLSKSPTFKVNSFGKTNPQYCYENTFNVDCQNQDQTTRVVVAVQLKFQPSAGATSTAEDLYAFNGDRSKLYKKADAENRVKDAIMHALEGKAGYANLQKSDIEVTFDERDGATGEVAIKEFKAPKDGETDKTSFTTGTEFDAVKAEVRTITMYEKGIAYYPIRIKHFGDQSTPWNVTGQGVTAGNIYPAGTDRDNWFLGRYGVLRNNWYDISVGDIKGVGTPTIPSTENIPDDELYNYISVRINILSWAKRTQHEDL